MRGHLTKYRQLIHWRQLNFKSFALKWKSLPWNQQLAFLILEIFNSAREKDFSLFRRADWPERWRAWLMPHANESPEISQRPHFPLYIFLYFYIYILYFIILLFIYIFYYLYIYIFLYYFYIFIYFIIFLYFIYFYIYFIILIFLYFIILYIFIYF